MEVKNWKDCIGNSFQKEILLNAMKRGVLPKILFFTGTSGIGKSTFADLMAKTILCENPQPNGEPCNYCKSCLQMNNDSNAGYIKKNMPELSKTFEMNDNIKEIFKTQKLSPKTVYVLEELHGLSKQLQKTLLEPLTKIPDDVYIISCTTEPYNILPELLGRAYITELQKPTTKECINFVLKLCDEYGIMPEDVPTIEAFIEACEHVPRKLKKIIQVISVDNNLTQDTLEKLFKTGKTETVLKVLEVMHNGDISDLARLFDSIKDTEDIYNIQKRIVEGIYEYLVCEKTENKQSKNRITEKLQRIVDDNGIDYIAKLMSLFVKESIKSKDSDNTKLSKLIEIKMKSDKIKEPRKSQASFKNIVQERNTVKQDIEDFGTNEFNNLVISSQSHLMKVMDLE